MQTAWLTIAGFICCAACALMFLISDTPAGVAFIFFAIAATICFATACKIWEDNR